ncbi:MAG: PSD1 domain-containing protein [Verrucomicrobia subdivision 3 bacterium]|nr:PSD1 domain-containing protein [Limisphaerales bacterium]
MITSKLNCLLRPALTLVAVFSLVDASPAANVPAKLDFNRDIRPILSDNCYACHGPDAGKRKAGLRLDLKDGALAPLKSGEVAIVPGDLAKSGLIARITTKDEDDLMPPVKSGKRLTAPQINLLKQWIAQGADWKAHWSFIKPERPPVPAVKSQRWPRNPIDSFILARLDKERLRPAKEADKATLIRRVTFDLTGLPPTLAEVDAFLADAKPDAYERLVDRLLQSPRYGEHEARYWLDVARYGDTHGLHLDNERSMWPYRDWVVSAFNRNQPFDQFTTEQLAGDLLPAPTREQKIASGFNRCNVSTSEGGAIDDEFYVRYAVDRAETTASVWMGLTVGCAVCHDHKFDPISQKEFYQFYAFFNNFNEKAMDGNALLPAPTMKLPTAAQEAKLGQLSESIVATEKRIREAAAKLKYTEPERAPSPATNQPADFVWVEDDYPKGAKAEASGAAGALKWVENEKVYSGKKAIARTDTGLAQDFFTQASPPLIIGAGDTLFAYVYLDPADPPKAIMLQYHTSEWLHRANWGDEDAIAFGAKGTSQKLLMGALPKAGEWVRLEIDAGKLGLKPGAKIDGIAFTQFGGTVYWDRVGIVTGTLQEDWAGLSLLAWEQQEKAKDKQDLPKDVADALKADAGKGNDAQKGALREYYLANIYTPARTTFEPLLKALKEERKQREALDNSLPATMISEEMEKPRGAFILKRGQYDQRGEPVSPGVPVVLPPLTSNRPTTNRLDLARWLVSPEHPLTARVSVNRFWQQFFGVGLVKSAGDFGAQGEWPSHPELLDWLACEFMQPSVAQPSTLNHQPLVGWDVKHLLRLIVTSATYRQNSSVTPKHWQADPANRLLARGPRFRLDAEMIRDNALFVSGLLVEKMGGRGVRPYQPSGIWEAVGYTSSNTAKFQQDHGEALYRRSLYTFWKRTAPPPYLSTFDAPSREKYCTRRERTDTPLQALVTMNDPAYVEAARHLSARMLEQTAKADDRLNFGFRLVTARQPAASERIVLQGALRTFLAKYESDPEAAKQLVSVGESPVNEKLNPSELAAYTMVASLLLNLDETLNKN